MSLRICVAAIVFLSIPFAPVLAEVRTRYKALCSSYGPFDPCEVHLYREGRITANIPRGYLDVLAKDVRSVEVCDADVRCKKLMGENMDYIWKDARISPFTAVVDFRFRYTNVFGDPKTVLFRFYNRSAAEEFGERLLMVSASGSSSESSSLGGHVLRAE